MKDNQKSERKTAKRLIKLAKANSKWYTKEDVKYAKLIRRSIKHNATSETNFGDSRCGENDRVHSKGEQPKKPRESKRKWFAWLLYKASTLVGL